MKSVKKKIRDDVEIQVETDIRILVGRNIKTPLENRIYFECLIDIRRQAMEHYELGCYL